MPFRGVRAAFAVAACLALAGCGDLPRPFSPTSKAVVPTDTLLPIDGAGVVVGGVLCPISAKAVVEALRQRDVPATVGAGNRGSMRLVCQADASWLLTSADKGRLGTIAYDTPDGVADRLLALIGRDVRPTSENQLPSLIVMPVVGAPGDGATALARAMALALKGRGAVLALQPDDETLLVMGSVVVTNQDASSQFVEVIWELLSPDGVRLGIINQENTIDTGALDGPWGAIAPAIASAGVDSMIGLIKNTATP